MEPANLARVGVMTPQIMLPRAGVDLLKWAVVACDQYTSDPGYWQEAAALVGNAPSTLHLILPEAFLGRDDDEARIGKIHQRMRDYLGTGVLAPAGRGMVLVERHTTRGRLRKGLVLAVDLECYDYRPGAASLIRATEGTVLDRLPPRVRIRRGAPLELPHILLLIDDPGRTVIEPLAAQAANLPVLYETELMLHGGRVLGRLVAEERLLAAVADSLSALAEPESSAANHGARNQAPMLFAVGDGNHSLAAAKVVWEEIKALGADSPVSHPARYALVEVENIHDEGLEFEPIHRMIFGREPESFFAAMAEYFTGAAGGFTIYPCAGKAEVAARLAGLRAGDRKAHYLPYQAGSSFGIAAIEEPRHRLEVGTLQAFLDDLAVKLPGLRVDYIHGDDVVDALAAEPGNIGFHLPPLAKRELFRTVLQDGALPKKTFSMGEADEKRFYIECRRIN